VPVGDRSRAGRRPLGVTCARPTACAENGALARACLRRVCRHAASVVAAGVPPAGVGGVPRPRLESHLKAPLPGRRDACPYNGSRSHLVTVLPPAMRDGWSPRGRRSSGASRPDDVLDAAAGAWTAQRRAEGRSQRLPEAGGLRLPVIWY